MPVLSFDSKKSDGFVEWKMMDVREYVLGLECGDCLSDGREAIRNCGILKILEPGQEMTYKVNVSITKNDAV